MADELTARGQIRAWVRKQLAGKAAVEIPQVTKSARRWLARDRALEEQLANELFDEAVYAIVQGEIAQTRVLRFYGDGGSAMTDEELARRAERFSKRFLNWYEHAGNRNVRVLNMDRDDLRLAASERRDRGAHEFNLAALWTQLADELSDDQVVGDRFTAEEIEQLYARIDRAQDEGVA